MKTQTLPDNKPKTAPLAYKPPLNLTPSLPVTQSYQPPYYNDPPSVYSSEYDPHVSQYTGEQLVSRGASTKPSPPSTGTFHELHGSGGYVRPKVDTDMYSSHNMPSKYDAYKDSGPAIYTTGTTIMGGYNNSEVIMSNMIYTTVLFTVVVYY